jgi:Cu+-exporting ATPase
MIETLEKISLKCYHCGDNCHDAAIHIESKVFCCNGCKTVYEILDDNALCNYYSLGTTPGIKINEVVKKEYEYLDDEKIKNSLLNFQEGDVSGVTFHIPSIHCSSCIWLLENLHKMHPGVITSTIQFQKKEVDVQFNNDINLKELAQLLSSLGYAPSITLNGKEVNKQSVNKSLYYKLGIAGFCFGNVMMLSLPDYLSVSDEFKGDIKTLFTYLSLLLSLPVFFYSASDYFTSAYSALKNKIINIDLPIALGLVAAFAQSTYEIVSGNGVGYMDSLTGLVFFLLVGKWYQSKTYEALSFDRDYKSYFPLAAAKLVDGIEHYVPLHELKVGDIITVRNQEIIPADSVIMQGGASIDYSFVTGESVPVSKKEGQQVFAGGKQSGATIRVMISREVSESYLTQLWNKDNTKVKTYGLTDFTNKIGKYFTIAVLIISAASYLFWVGKDSSIALYSAVSVLIIFCPCIFALAIPFGFGNAMNILGRNGFFLKNTQTIEKLATNDTIVFDKTGTITSSGESEVEFEGFLTIEEKQFVKSLVTNSTHPLCRVLSNELSTINSLDVDSFAEIPSLGIKGRIGNHEIKVGSASFVELAENKRPLENSHTRVFVSINGEVKACYKFKNKYRENLGGILSRLKKKFQIHLLSGDNDAEKDYLSTYFKSYNLHFNQSPTNKLAYIKRISEKHKVIMIGDGLNDAGALMNSNCGISITEKSGNFSPACDGILEAKNFSKLPDFIEYSRACVKSVYWSLAVSLSYNIVGLYFAVQGNLKPLVAAILMPASSVSVVLFVTLMSKLLAKRYGLK